MFNKFTKTVAMLLLVSTLLTLIIPSVSFAFEPVPEMGSIEEILEAYYDPSGRPMSCAHRAITYIGNPTPENSLLAIQECIDAKVDIVELDIMRTSDGVFVLCHDSSIKRTTTYDGGLNVSSMTYGEICQYPLLKGEGNSDVYYDPNGQTLVMPTFEQALELCRDNCMINLDKFTGQWAYRMELYELVKSKGCLKNVMFKGKYSSDQISAWYAEIKAKYGADAELPTFCVLNSTRDPAQYQSAMKVFGESGTASAVESSFGEYGNAQTDRATHDYIHQYMRTFSNVLTESLNSNTHCAGLKENSTGWAEIIALGYNILQTNNSADLAAYIHANYSGKSKDISQGLNVAHFSDYKHDQNNTSVEVSGKGVSLKDGDWISFEDVDFSKSAGKKLMLSFQSTAKSGTLKITRNAIDGDIIASFDLSKNSGGDNTLAYDLDKSINDVMDIYVSVSGLGSEEFITLSAISVPENGYGNVMSVVGTSVFTTPCKAPKMPDKVKVITDIGYIYEAEVTWGPIPVECYASPMSYFKVPGTLKDTNELVFAEVMVLSTDMSDVSIWFDANSGVMLEDGYVSQWIDRVNGVKAIADGSGRPIYSGSEISDNNGAVLFDGIDDYFTYTNDLNGKQNLTFITYSATKKASTDYYSDYTINNAARYTLLHYPELDSWGSIWLTTFKNGVACRFGSGVSGNRGIYYKTEADGWTVTAATKDKTDECIYLNGELVYDRSNDTSSAYSAGEAGNSIANTHAYAYIGLGIQSSNNYYYEGSVSDIIVFDRTLTSEEILEVSKYLRAKSEGVISDYSEIVLSAYEKYLSEKESVEKVPNSMNVPANPVDILGGDSIFVIVVISAVVFVGAFVVAVVVIKKRKD